MAYRVAAEKSGDSLMEFPLYVTCCFIPAAFKAVSLTFAILITICLGVSLFGFILFGTVFPGPE